MDEEDILEGKLYSLEMMRDMRKENNQYLNLPPVKNLFPLHGHSFRYRIPHRFLWVDTFDIGVSGINLQEYLKRPSELIEDLLSALDAQGKLKESEQKGSRIQGYHPHQINIMRGYWLPTITAPWDCVDKNPDYLTVSVMDTDNSHEVIACSQYISADKLRSIVPQPEQRKLVTKEDVESEKADIRAKIQALKHELEALENMEID